MNAAFPRIASFLLIVTQLLPGPCARSQDFPTDEAGVARLLKATGIRPVRPPAEARKYEDFQREDLLWIRKHAIEPALAKLRKEKYGDRVAAFVEKVLIPLMEDQISAEQGVTLRAEGGAFYREEIKEPLLDYVMALLWSTAGNRDNIDAWYYSVVRHLDPKVEDPEYAMFDLVAITQYAAVRGRMSDQLRARVVRRIEEAVVRNAFADNPHLMATYFIAGVELSPADTDHLMAICAKSSAPDWTKKLILGAVEINLAWKERGDGFADTVTEAGWQGFRMHLKKARELLTESWKLNPKDPMAATCMISVVMGEGPTKGEDFQSWHERAIAACADYPDAYSRVERALMPRWHGSKAHEIAFAFACADTNRRDSSIPNRFISALDRLDDELEDPRELYRVPAVAERVVRIYRAKLDAHNNATEATVNLGKLAVYGWLAGRSDVAREAVLKMGGGWPRMIDPLIHEYEIGRNAFVFDCLTSGTWLAPVAKAASAARDQRKFDEARLMLSSMIPSVPLAGKPYLWESIRLISIEEKLGGGDWVSLTGENAYVGWLPIEGQIYSRGRNGALFAGGNARFRTMFTGRVGSDFELRGKVKFKQSSTRYAAFGVLFERNPIGAGMNQRSALTMEVKLDSPTAGTAALVYRGTRVSEPGSVEVKETNEFHFRKVANRVTLTWNGKEILAEIPKDYPVQTHPLMGLGWMPQPYGTETEVRDLEIRRLSKEL